MNDFRNDFNIECPRANGMYLEAAPQEIWDGGWVLEDKLDGERCTLQFGASENLLVGRNRQDFLKGASKAGAFRHRTDTNPILASACHHLLEGTMLDGEQTEIFRQNGELDKATKIRIIEDGWVGYWTWGVLFYKGRDVRYWTEEDRYEAAGEAVKIANEVAGAEKFRLVRRIPATRANLDEIFESHAEGAIAKKLGEGIPTNSRVNKNWWKLKGAAFRTVDAFVIGVTQAKSGGSGLTGVKPKYNGTTASFVMALQTENGPVEVCKMGNLPSDAVLNGFKNPERYIGRVVEMQVSGWNGQAFRWARFKRWRDDKTYRDCMWDDQLGGRHG